MDLKLLVAYNIRPNREAEYYRYVLGEFLPRLQNVGLLMVEGWHTAYGNYPIRLLVFKTQDEANLQRIMQSKEWQEGKETLLKLVRDYEECLVLAKTSFQFFIPAGRRSG
ncbi:MAG: hypothetical protein FOGNACKC_04881 [Anaerolineae bacterium]|nr:hypothetical protein [Anaerolineae bacterium]